MFLNLENDFLKVLGSKELWTWVMVGIAADLD